MLAAANALTLTSPINNFHYPTENILFNFTNDNIENQTTCSFTLNLVDAGTYEINSNETVVHYMPDVASTNVLGINCTDPSGETDYITSSTVFYYTPLITDTSDSSVIIPIMAFLLTIVFLFVIFKLKA